MIFSNHQLWPLVLFSALFLLAMAWLAWSTPAKNSNSPERIVPWCLRSIGILLIAFALLDPVSTQKVPTKGENVVALLADDSRSSRFTDEGEVRTRAEILKAYLVKNQATWQRELAETYQLRSYRYDHSLNRVSDFDKLTFEGNYSETGKALNSLSKRLQKRPLAGIVLFSDGVATDQALSLDQLSTLPPVYPVVIGSKEQAPDVSIIDYDVQQSAFSDSPLTLNASLGQSNFDGESTTLRLSQLNRSSREQRSTSLDKTLIVEQQLELDAPSAHANFEWQTEGGGVQFFEVEALLKSELPDTEERNIENNRRLFAVDKGKSEYRILYVTGRPNWEYKFLNRALSSDDRLSIVGLIRVATQEPNFEFKSRAGESSNALYRGFGREEENERYDEAVMIRMNTRDENELLTGFPSEPRVLFEYDALIIDDLEADFFSFTQQTLIRDFVKLRGGGLLLLGGANSFEDGGYANSPIAQALPVSLSSERSNSTLTPASWELTRSGWVTPWTRIRSVDSDEKLRIQRMPQFNVYNAFTRTRPGSETLITLQIPGTSNLPALVTRRYGSGRVATMSIGDLWRWGMQNSGTQADLSQFWRQISRWLVTDTPERIDLNVHTTNGGEVELAARVLDFEYTPLQLGEAYLEIKNLSSESPPVRVAMDAAPGSDGKFIAKYRSQEEGAFIARIEVLDSEGERVGSAETGWTNHPLFKEFLHSHPDRSYLQRIADATGGKLLELRDLDKLAELVSSNPSPVMKTRSTHVWHNNWIFLLAMISILGEWFLRRRKGFA